MPAQADPDLALLLAKETAQVYGQGTDDMLAIVARRVARGVDSPGWAERKLIEQADLRNEAARVITRLEKHGPAAAGDAIRAAWRDGAALGADEMGITPTFGRTNTRAVDAFVREAVTGLQGTHGQILRSVEDSYRQVIRETASSVLTGTQTRRQAAQSALNRLADRGITGFRDRAGRNWSLDSYAEMATRTAVGRAQVAGTLDRFVAAGRDLVIVSDAPQECALCRPYEGRVFSITGADQRYPALSSASGLFHANCRHSVGAFIPGLTKPLRGTADPQGDRNRQEQRYLERGVRHWKRRELVALDPQAKRRAAARRRQWEDRLAKHVDDHGLKRLRYRESIGDGPAIPAGSVPKPKAAAAARAGGAEPIEASRAITSMPTTRSGVGREVRQSLAAIERVHRIPGDLEPVPVQSATRAPHKRGLFRWSTDGRPVHIEINTAGDGKAATFAHEFGHYLDHGGLGPKAGTFGSTNPDRLMRGFLRAVDASPTSKALAAAPSESYTRYLQDRREVFARAYAQWIARRSGDPAMAAQLQAVRGQTGPGRFAQWGDDEFEPIAQALDAIFESRGLLR